MNNLASTKIYWLLLGLLLNFSVRADTSTPPTNPYQTQINTVNQVMANLTNPNYPIQPIYIPSAIQSVTQQFMKGFNAVFSTRMTQGTSNRTLSQPITAATSTIQNMYSSQQSAPVNNTHSLWSQAPTSTNNNSDANNQQPPILSGF